MATFNRTARPTVSTPTINHEGGPAVELSPLLQLQFGAACTLVGQDTYYESADARNARLIGLVDQLATKDLNRTCEVIEQLRGDYKIRACSIMLAAELVARAQGTRVTQLIDNVCQRPDEPAELLAYWLNTRGRKLPRAVKRGLAAAAVRLYSERSWLKWDSSSHEVRMADVIELCHPIPQDRRQGSLFRYILDTRHRGKEAWHIDQVEGRGERYRPVELSTLRARIQLHEMPKDKRSLWLKAASRHDLAGAAVTWEYLSSWAPHGMDATAWETVIPSMGVMALIRNLRNFDKAGISGATVEQVIDKITDAEEVAKARLFPYQVFSAYAAAPSDNWARALNQTFEHAVGNMPDVGKALILVDTSGSMNQELSARSRVRRVEAAAVQAVALAQRSPKAALMVFGVHAAYVVDIPGESAMKRIARVVHSVGSQGHGTMGHSAIRAATQARTEKGRAQYDRVVMFTDDQMQDSHLDISFVPTMVTFDLAGYRAVSNWNNKPGHRNIRVAGFSEAGFQAMWCLIEGD